MSRVEFFRDGQLLGTDPSVPYEWTWSKVGAGSCQLTARASDADGATSESAAVRITVRDSLGITLTSPVAEATYCPGVLVTFAATIQGPLPAGGWVEFGLDGAVVGRGLSYPFSYQQTGGLLPGAYEAWARLLDGSGAVLASAAPVRFRVEEACADVAILRNYADPEVERMVSLLEAELGYRVEVFDQNEVSVERLAGYKLIVWVGLARAGEGLSDGDVDQLRTLHGLGRSLYLLGGRVLSDTGRLTAERRAAFETLSGMRPAGAGVTAERLTLLAAGHGDPIVEGPYGGLSPSWQVSGRAEPGELTVTNTFQVKLALDGAPVMAVRPAVCAPELGQARVATQAFGLGADGDSERLFKSTVRWLMRDWVCENLEVLVTGAGEQPGTGRVGEALTYAYRVSQSGACAAIGVVLSEELPAGWVVAGVETTAGSWEEAGSRLVTTVGCMDVAGAAEVKWRLIPTRPGTYTHRVTVAAAREEFNGQKHVVETTTVVEGGELAPRLELRAAVTGGGWELWVFGAAGTAYRVEHATELKDPPAGTVWEVVGTANGPQGKVVLPGLAGRTHYFRAVWP